LGGIVISHPVLTNFGTPMSNTEVKIKIKPNTKIAEPSLFKIIYINDDVTTMDFVVKSLLDIFDYTVHDAIDMTEIIHVNGSAIVATLPYELAEQKGMEVTMEARREGFPLLVKVESEN
jgi:ATP-dependent Clp protease adaptor protein ClpS